MLGRCRRKNKILNFPNNYAILRVHLINQIEESRWVRLFYRRQKKA